MAIKCIFPLLRRNRLVENPQVFRFIVNPRNSNDPRSSGYLADAHALGYSQVTKIRCSDLYFIAGQLDTAQLNRLALEILSDPITQKVEWTPVDPARPGRCRVPAPSSK